MTPCENKDKLKPGEGLVDSIATQQPFPACCSCSPPRKQLKGQILDFPASCCGGCISGLAMIGSSVIVSAGT